MSKDQKSNVSKNVETVEILIPLLKSEMEEVNNLSKPILCQFFIYRTRLNEKLN